MAWKKLTFILIPHTGESMKQVSIPRMLVYLVVAFRIASTGLMIFYILGFKDKEFYLSRTREINQQNIILEENIAFFDSAITTLSTKVDSIENMNDNIKQTYNVKDQSLRAGSDEFSVEVSESGLTLPIAQVLSLVKRLDMRSTAFEQNMEYTYSLCMTKNDYLNALPSIKPADGYIFKKFGPGFDQLTGTVKNHPGVDITNIEGTPVYATADGVIEEIVNYSDEFGRYIVINHKNGYKTKYCHLQTIQQMENKSINPHIGQEVKRGEQIGSMGRTGLPPVLAVSPHVTYIIMHHGILIDPMNYFIRSRFDMSMEPEMLAAQTE
jgi:murein DD-endopeptidase MepM/ murein hydrolase activator NlpD